MPADWHPGIPIQTDELSAMDNFFQIIRILIKDKPEDHEKLLLADHYVIRNACWFFPDNP
jgi:hypothetical protein